MRSSPAPRTRARHFDSPSLIQDISNEIQIFTGMDFIITKNQATGKDEVTATVTWKLFKNGSAAEDYDPPEIRAPAPGELTSFSAVMKKQGFDQVF